MQIVIINSKGGCGKSTLALSIADVLDAQIVDHDPQGTLTVSATFTNRRSPVALEDANARFVVHDTPPYNGVEYKSLLSSADLIIIPAKVGVPDLLAIKGVAEQLRSLKMEGKAYVVFNEVRLPHNNTYKKVKAFYYNNYKDIKKAKTELSSLVSYRNVLEAPISGKALQEVSSLLKEIGIDRF